MTDGKTGTGGTDTSPEKPSPEKRSPEKKSPEKQDQPLFQPNLEILSGGRNAPLALAPNSRLSLQGAFRLALERDGARAEQVLSAATTGGGLVHASQEFVRISNRLISESEPREVMADVVRGLLGSCREFLGFRDTTYALKQAVEGVHGADQDLRPTFREMKNLSEPLERRLEALGLPVRMDPVRFAFVQVHLDELYDRASRMLQLFYHVLSAPESPGSFSAFCRTLSSVSAKEIIPDLVLGQGAGQGNERTGLAVLLPELEREFL